MTDMLTNAQAATAETVKALVAESDAAALASIDRALEAGRLLVDAKEAAPHGTWLPFLQRAGVPERKAQRLMTLARSGLKSDTVSEMGGITAALKILSRRKLPKAGSCLEITAKHGGGGTTVGALWPSAAHPGFYFCAVMQAPEDLEASAPVVWTRRPISGERFTEDGEAYEPVWKFFETHMGAPASLWEYDDDGVMPRILADRLDLPFLHLEAEKARLDRGELGYCHPATLDLIESVGFGAAA